MAKKSKSHTGFRNNALFCFNCGRSYQIVYPQPVSMATAMMKQFEKDHKHCEPTWKEPVPDMTKSITERMSFWCQHGEHGMSSMVMYNTLSGTQTFPHKFTSPSDPSDFLRCHKLLQCVPEWNAVFYKLKNVSPKWNALVENWDKLTALLEEQLVTQKDNGMYDLMESITKDL